MIDLRIELPQESRRLFRLDPDAMRFAEAQALTRTAANVQTVALQSVAHEMGVPVSTLKKRGRDVRVALSRAGSRAGKFGTIATRKATRRTLAAQVRGFGRPFNAGRWDGAEIKPGAQVSLKSKRQRKGKGRAIGTTHRAYGRSQFARNTWMLKNRAIVVRDGPSFRGVFGPGVTQVMLYPHILTRLQREANERFIGHFTAAVNFAFTSAGRRVFAR